ncbi:MAG TPA: ankyrin repeat domain-containing protein [Stellaceae bacterium]|nr:ankyrin repeat domain-containing protein [Stellaceae bacterium]
MTRKLDGAEIEEIRQRYNHLWNWRSDGPDAPIDPLTFVDPTGDSLLHIAAWRGDRRTVELLIGAGIDINKIGDMGCTALHYAIMNGHADLANFLLQQGASQDIRKHFGGLPRESAKR